MGDQRPGGIVQVGEFRIALRFAYEALARLIDILAADLEQAVCIAQRADAAQLGARVAAGHVGDGAIADLRKVRNQFIQEIIFELLRALIAGHAVTDVAQIGVGGNRADAVGQRQYLVYVRQLFIGVDVEPRDQLALDPAQQIVHRVRIFIVGQIAFDLGGQRQLKLGLDEADQLFAAADHVQHAVRQRAGNVALGHGAALCVIRKRQHIALKIDGHAVFAHHFIHRRHHFAVAFVALFTVRREEIVQFPRAVVRHAVQRHVRHACLIGVVQLAIAEGRIFHGYAAFQTDRGAHLRGLCRRQEFIRARDGIMIHQAAGAKPRRAGEPYRRRGRVGGEGIGGMDVVVHIASGDRRWLGFHQRLQIFNAVRGVQKRQQFFACLCHTYVSFR